MIKDIPVRNFESGRLYYEPIAMSHATSDYLGWLNDAEVNKYLEVKKENTLEELRAYIQDALEKKIFFWAIHLKANGKHIGNIKIDPINCKHGTGEYGIMMGDKSEWSKGYAKESSIAVIDFCFGELNLRKMTLGVLEYNVAAVQLYQKLGFTTEGIYKKHVLHDGIYCNILRMALFNPTYKY